jgi:hydrogenase/urease accessory protein HupE
VKAAAVAALLLAAPPVARAHDAGISYSELAIERDRVEASLRISAADLGVRPGVEPGAGAIGETLGTFAVAQGGRPCRFEPGAARREPPDGVRVTGAFRCDRPGAPVRIRVGLLDRMPWGHTHLAKVTAGARAEERVVRAGRETFEVEAPATWAEQAVRFLRLGLEHIFTGYDHVAFVLGLLFLGGGLRGLLRVVTSFTAAHSITLALASFQVVSLPARLVEPLIAASIVFVAAENLVRLRAAEAGRWRLAFAFGLVHGFGFAGALSELHLSRADLATALLSFNVGVEAGQAAIIAAALPLLGLLRRRPGPARLALRAGSAAIGAAGVFWLVQRLPWR